MATNNHYYNQELSSSRYLNSLVDDFGIWQHTDGQTIDRTHGYALDDVARALLYYRLTGDETRTRIMDTYLKSAWQDGRFYGFCTAEHTFTDYPSSEDAHGEALWALCSSDQAVKLVSQVALSTQNFTSLRGKAYALLGLTQTNQSAALKLFGHLRSLLEKCNPEWPWPEKKVTYGNAIVPYALLQHIRIHSGDGRPALKALDFLNATSDHDNWMAPIGNQGWYPQGGEPAHYDQQAIDASYSTLANIAAWQITHEEKYLVFALRWYEWFMGENSLGTSMVDRDGRCSDGIQSNGLNPNSGAESVLSFLLADYAIKKQQTF